MRFRKLAAVWFLLSLAPAAPCAAQGGATPGAGADSAAAVPAVPPAPVPLPAPVPPPALAKPRAPHTHTAPAPRSAWMFGLGLGYGWGGPRSAGVSPDQETSGTIHARVGCGVSPRAVVSIEYLQWFANPSDTTSWKVQVAGPSLTWYWPNNLFARGTLGWGSMKTDFEAPLGTPPGHQLIEVQDDGFGFVFAGGWEWRYRRRLAVTPQVEWAHVRATQGTSADVTAASIQLNWYF